MQPLWRALMIIAAGLASAPALAQSAPASTPDSSGPSGDLIGPPQLSNFSLKGKVTQPAAPQAAPATQPPTATRPQRQPTDTSTATEAPAPTSPEKLPVPIETAQRESPSAGKTSARAQPKARSDSLQTTATQQTPPPQPLTTTDAVSSASLPAAAIAGQNPATGSAWLSKLLWLLAAAAAAGAAGWYFLWQRPRTGLVPAGGISRFEAPRAQPRPPAAPPRVTPTPPQPKPAGIVSTRLRPWIELEFIPGRVIIDQEKAVIEFQMAIFNSGSAPALDLLVEGAMFNAGPAQDEQIAGFFEKPIAQGNRIPLIAPLQRLAVTSAVALSRSQLYPLEIDGRPLLVPLAAFNALYRWGNHSEGQTSTSYLVGKVTNGEKLAPFRLDASPRIFRRLEAREHELRIRK